MSASARPTGFTTNGRKYIPRTELCALESISSPPSAKSTPGSDYCAKEGLTYFDYYSAMSDEKGAMKPGLAKDGVHPTAAGYAIMGPLAEAAIARTLQK